MTSLQISTAYKQKTVTYNALNCILGTSNSAAFMAVGPVDGWTMPLGETHERNY